MPRKYKRKDTAKPRVRNWTTAGLQAALMDMDKKVMSINKISQIYGIPARTLRRRFTGKKDTELPLGKHPILGFDNEKRLVAHIKRLGEAGFPPSRPMIRTLAFEFAEKLNIHHNFNKEDRMAGYQWMQSFMDRNPDLSIRISEGLSIARAQSLNREEFNNFYEILTKVLTENDLLNKPDRIFNMDETGVQLNNKPGKVIASKGAKVVHTVTSAEKGETITLVACCSAAGTYFPPVLIIKGVNKKPEFENGLPPGSKVFMNKKSAYINTELFKKWLTDHFIANKPQGKVLLILDGHSSHSSAIDMLETARENEVIILCLPSHTTSLLQPLDRAVFKPFKTYLNAETNHFIRTNPEKKITRYNCAQLIAKAWLRTATPTNALAGFRGSGIYPINQDAISDCEFTISIHNHQNTGQDKCTSAVALDNISVVTPSSKNTHRYSPSILISSQDKSDVENLTDAEEDINQMEYQQKQTTPRSPTVDFQPHATEKDNMVNRDTVSDQIHSNPTTDTLKNNKETPSKYLLEKSPIPTLPTPLYKRGKQTASVLTSAANITLKNQMKHNKITKQTGKEKKTKEQTTSKKESNNVKKLPGKRQPVCKNNNNNKIRPMRIDSSSGDEENNFDSDDKENCFCCKCFEDYEGTKSKSDWIQCTLCKNWLHETCTVFRNTCDKCGRLAIIAGQ